MQPLRNLLSGRNCLAGASEAPAAETEGTTGAGFLSNQSGQLKGCLC